MLRKQRKKYLSPFGMVKDLRVNVVKLYFPVTGARVSFSNSLIKLFKYN